MEVKEMKQLKKLLKQYKKYRKDKWTRHDVKMLLAEVEFDINKLKNNDRVDSMLTVGDKVKVMYPYDASWWETRGVVIELEDETMCKVQDYYGNKVSIDVNYLEIL